MGVEAEVDEEIAAAIEAADSAPLEPVEDLLRFVTTDAKDSPDDVAALDAVVAGRST